MTIGNELAVLVEGGMLRPERKLNFPEHTRLVITIRRVETTPEAEETARRALHEIRERGEVCLGGWHPTRDEMHERR